MKYSENLITNTPVNFKKPNKFPFSSPEAVDGTKVMNNLLLFKDS